MEVTTSKGPSAASTPPTTSKTEGIPRPPERAAGTPFRSLVVGMGMKARARAKPRLGTSTAPGAGGREPTPTTREAPKTPATAGSPPATEGKGAHARDRDRDAGDGADEKDAKKGPHTSEADLLDPSTRHLAHLAPPMAAANASTAARDAVHETVVRGRSLEELLPALVKRIAWAGDRQRATVRLELGAGAYAGTTLVVHADGGKVRVETFGDGGADLDRLRERIDARLRGHGLDVESVT